MFPILCVCLCTFFHLDLWRLRTESYHIQISPMFQIKTQTTEPEAFLWDYSLETLTWTCEDTYKTNFIVTLTYQNQPPVPSVRLVTDEVSLWCDMRWYRRFHFFIYTMLCCIFFNKYTLLLKLFFKAVKKKSVSPSEINVLIHSRTACILLKYSGRSRLTLHSASH